MRKTQRIIIIIALVISLTATLYIMGCMALWTGLHFWDGSFSRSVSDNEVRIRSDMVSDAAKWLGTQECSPQHEQLLLIYNGQESLPRGYEVTLSDNWCAAYGSTVAIENGLTRIIPTECGCERQIELWKQISCWTEKDTYLPLPGDYIYYNWNETPGLRDNTGWADHVGIVAGTAGPMIKVIEGNKDDSVTYRVISRWDYRIRGYGLPDYASIG